MNLKSDTSTLFHELSKSHKSILFYVEVGEFWTNQDFKFETNLRLLPFHQQAKIVSKRFAIDAQTALANQLLQRFISCLFKETVDINAVQFGFNSFGKPYLLDNTTENGTLSFSMSNQQGFTSMLINIEGKEVGVDLASVSDCDKFGPEDQLISNFKDIFHEDEFSFLNGMIGKEMELYFTAYWALKESYAKKIGVGLNADLKSFNFKDVNMIEFLDDNQRDDAHLLIQKVKWMNSTILSIYDNIEQGLGIFVTRLIKDLLVSVVGDDLAEQTPLVVKVPLDTIIEYFG